MTPIENSSKVQVFEVEKIRSRVYCFQYACSHVRRVKEVVFEHGTIKSQFAQGTLLPIITQYEQQFNLKC
jgi:hypothetical protein